MTYASKPLSLTQKEYMILECFLKNPTQVLTRSAILDKLWDFDKLSGEETVKTHLTKFKKKTQIGRRFRGFLSKLFTVLVIACVLKNKYKFS